jgi:hypothetical protein
MCVISSLPHAEDRGRQLFALFALHAVDRVIEDPRGGREVSPT